MNPAPQKQVEYPKDLPVELPLIVVSRIADVIGEVPSKHAWRLMAELDAATSKACKKHDAAQKTEPPKEG